MQSDFFNFDFVRCWNRDLNRWEIVDGVPIPEQSDDVSTSPTEDIQQSPPFLKEKAQIETLKEINGLSIEEIEDRARPGRYSQTGFIGREESFKEVLRKDWETVEKLHVTHSELAAHLTNIISIAERVERSSKRDFSDSFVIEYRTNDLKDNSILSEAPQKLEVLLLLTKGMQDDIFEPKHNSTRVVNTLKEWNEENTVKNPANGVTLNLNSGILSYIREFGFYEGGGEDNPYRVDPLKVMALLTGKSLEELKRNYGCS
jgi:hypothetical protein